MRGREDQPFLHLPGGRRHTLADLLTEAGEFAALATATGVEPGSVVLLEFARANWPAFVAAYLGCRLHGLVPAVISAEDGAARAEAVRSALPVRWHVRAAEPVHRLAEAQRTLLPGGSGAVTAGEYLVTSGTTGAPKLVPISEAARLAADTGGRGSGVLALTAPPGSNAALTALAEALLGERGGLAVLPRWSPEELPDLVAASGASALLLAPALLLSLLRSPRFDPAALAGLRVVRLGMAPAPDFLVEEVAAALPWVAVRNIYTTTEAWPAGTVMRRDRDDPRSVGRPLPGTVIRIVGDDDQDLPAGATGRVLLGRTAEPGRWVDTGDLGSLTGDGALVLAGRAHDLITRGGTLVSFPAVDEALLSSGLLADAGAFAEGDTLTAAVVWRGEPRETELLAHVTRRLGADATPRLVTVTELPRDEQGKLRRDRLSAPARDTGAAERAEGPAAEVRAIWAEVLARPAAEPDEDFFAVGGDSLAAVMCNTLLEERLGVRLPLSRHYEARTLRQLTEAVTGELASAR